MSSQKWIKLGSGFPPDPEKLWHKIEDVNISEDEWRKIAYETKIVPVFEGDRDLNDLGLRA